MVRWSALAVVAIAGLMAGAKAQDRGPPDIVFDATARTGTDTRPVRFRFFCSSNGGPNVTGVLAVELEIPQYEQLRPVFDFDPFEGPDAHAGPLTRLRSAGVRSKASGRFTAAGSIIPAGAFMLGGRHIAAGTRAAAKTGRHPAPVDRGAGAVGLAARQRQTGWHAHDCDPGRGPDPIGAVEIWAWPLSRRTIGRATEERHV